jgi:hypothetical protein
MTRDWPRIRYRDFYDVPRAVVVEWAGSLYLFDCPFDDDLDGYGSSYIVYRIPALMRDRIDEISWTDLVHIGDRLGVVPTAEVEFDETRRGSMNPAVFGSFRET